MKRPQGHTTQETHQEMR